MAVIEVERSDTFEDWRQKTNRIGESLGDVSELGGSTVIEKIEESNDLALALAIALGG